MAVTKVVEIVSRVQTLLQDAGATRWPLLEIQNWLNDAYKEIVILKPSSNTLVGTFTCAVGTKQTLTVGFPTATRLIDIVRNVAATSAKKAVRPIDRRILDDQRPGWHNETGVIDVQHYVFDDRMPVHFWVYPPALTTSQLEVAYAAVPTPHALTEAQLGNAGTADPINLDDSYANAILDYILYRSFLKDVEYAANTQRAVAHYQAMAASLGVRTKIEFAQSPNVKPQGE